jgi:hypothetical protein
MVKESKNKKFCDDFFKRYEKCKKIHFKKVDIDKIRAKVIGALFMKIPIDLTILYVIG